MFNRWDILTSALLAVAIAVCAWGAVVSEGPGRAVSILTGLSFISGAGVLVSFKLWAGSATFITGWGLRVRHQGVLNVPAQLLVEQWSRELSDALRPEYPVRNLPAMFNDSLAVFVDDEKMSAAGRWVRGYTQGSVAVIGMRGPDIYDSATRRYVRSLFLHEMGHILLTKLGVRYNEKVQHAILAKLGIS